MSNDYSRLIAAVNEGNCLLAGSKGGGVTPEELTQFLQLALVSAASLAGRPLKLWTRRAASLHPTGTFHADKDSIAQPADAVTSAMSTRGFKDHSDKSGLDAVAALTRP